MRHLIWDTETTDLIKNSLRPLNKQPRMMEFFGLVLDDDLEEIEVCHKLINPGIPISDVVKGITRIDDEMVKDLPKFGDRSVFLPIVDIIMRSDIIVAHNLSYDMSVIEFELERIGEKKLIEKWPRGVCTVESTEHLKGHRLKLSDLYYHLFGEKFDGAHRAEQDVRALAKCYKELIKRGEI